jgi:hypothetical protein
MGALQLRLIKVSPALVEQFARSQVIIGKADGRGMSVIERRKGKGLRDAVRFFLQPLIDRPAHGA